MKYLIAYLIGFILAVLMRGNNDNRFKYWTAPRSKS